MFERKFTNILACALLGIMLILAVASMWNDSVIMDESPHIAAGYSYLKYKDMRLNPEHPPLIKDIAALPLQFMDLKFPNDGKAWKENINDQWVLGSQFLYESGNNPDKIIFWGRIGPILIMLLLGFYIFKWTLEEFGDKTALMALTLYVFSPTILAHGRFVTTDIGATAGIFISIYYFVKFLRNKTPKFFILASLALFKRINNWTKLYRLAKENHIEKQVGALYDLTREIIKVRKMKVRFRNNSLPKKENKFEYIIPKLKSKDFKKIEKLWKVYLPFNKEDLEEYK